jgi:antitoxin CptB
MTGDAAHSSISAHEDDMDIARKRIRLRAWRRGMREMDLIMGGYADAKLAALGAEQLAEFEYLLDLPDDETFLWISGARPVPPERDTALFRDILAFHAHEGPIH